MTASIETNGIDNHIEVHWKDGGDSGAANEEDYKKLVRESSYLSETSTAMITRSSSEIMDDDDTISIPQILSFCSPLGICKSLSLYLRSGYMKELLFCVLFAVLWYKAGKWILMPFMGVHERVIPYQVTKSGDVILDFALSKPLTMDVTFPGPKLISTSIHTPLILIFTLAYFLRSKHVSLDAHSGLCSTLFSIGISAFTTDVLKLYVGRLRPNFYALCGFDVATLQCTAPPRAQLEARMSFPSGHSSLSFSGMTVLALYLLGRVAVGRSNMTWKKKFLGVLALGPFAVAMCVAASRLVDNWHHPSDVLGGSLLGFCSGVIGYHLWYPHVLSWNAGVPYASLEGINGKEGKAQELPRFLQ